MAAGAASGVAAGAAFGVPLGPAGIALGGVAGGVGALVIANKYVVPKYIDRLERIKNKEKFIKMCNIL